ncbi:MAG TPA: DNA-binding response regulator, partial [Chloroflexi bacterium]|nr:DNA-binding response regulator [Chloroflexota bacterium]
MDPIRVLIVDDHAMVRVGLKHCLASYRGISVVGEAADGQDALRKMEACQPQIVLMDLVMP